MLPDESLYSAQHGIALIKRSVYREIMGQPGVYSGLDIAQRLGICPVVTQAVIHMLRDAGTIEAEPVTGRFRLHRRPEPSA